MKHNLQQQIPQFLSQIIDVSTRNRIGHLVSFLDGVGGNAREILRQVPRASGAGRAQRSHDLQEPGDIGHQRTENG